MKSGAKEILYGSSVLPGSMLMIAYIENVPVIGVPACALYAKATSFDLVYPRILAGEMITRNDLSRLGHGGLCRQCDICRYPLCPFGKGT
jgi:molybdopterin biosynthesis enzyme